MLARFLFFTLLLTSTAAAQDAGLEGDAGPAGDAGADAADAADAADQADQADQADEADAVTTEPAVDPAALDRARELFLVGVAHFEAGEFEEAISTFEDAIEVHDATSIRFNLASAYSENRQWVEAYKQVMLLQAREDLDETMQREARRLERRLRGRVGRIELRSSDELDELRLDGEVIEAGLLVVEPGEHVVEGWREGTVAVRREVDVARRERLTVDLAVVTVREVVEVREPEEPPSNAPRIRRAVGITAALVAVGVVVAVVIATRSPDPVRGNLEPGVIRW